MTSESESPVRRTSIGPQRNPASQDAILAAAEALLVEHGLSGFSVEAVARRAKAGKPTIYRWWPSKSALLLEVYNRQKHVLRYPDTGDIERDLVVFLEGLFAFWMRGSGGAVFRSIIAEAQSDKGAAEALAVYAAERRRQTGEVIARAQRRGEVAAEADPELIADALSGFAWIRLLTNRLEDSSDEIRSFVHSVVQGIRSR